MKNKYLKTILPHIIAFITMIIVAGVYFSPSFFHGKVLTQSDIVQAKGMQAEITKYKEATGEHILWTNAMFGGMPTYQIAGGGWNVYNIVGKAVTKITRLNKNVTNPYALLFTLFFGFYLLLISLKMDWKLSLPAAIIYGLCTSHIHLIDGGHLNKVLTIAYLAPALAGVLLAFRGRYLIGGLIFAIFMDQQIGANHFQITYYFLFILLFLGFVELYKASKAKAFSHFFKAAGILALGLAISLMVNLPRLWSTSEYAKDTIRGKSELVKAGESAPRKDGLDKSYAFSWSLGKMETFSLLVPNFMGATSQEAFVQDKKSASLKALRALNNPQQANSLAQASSKYWGDQPFTSGAPYYGAIIIFLFFLGAFLVKDVNKWWMIAGTILMILFSWGRNFPLLNYTMFDYFPMFNKFRAVSMAVSLGHVLTVLLGIMGIKELMNAARDKSEKQKALYAALGFAGGLCLLALLLSVVMTLEGPRDGALAQFPDYLNAIREDRASILQKDAFRSLGFIVAAAALVFFYLKTNFNKYILIAVLCLMAIVDFWGINHRYLSNEEFVSPRKSQQVKEARPVDKQIMADPDLYYRVMDLTTGNPFSNALPCYFHKNTGGYHAAKLIIYQELIERYLSNPGKNMHILGMLNTKYIIGGQQGAAPQASRIPEALGNAWFVDEFKLVNNANAELDALADFEPSKTAVIQKRFESYLSGLNTAGAPTDEIKLVAYHPEKLEYESNAASERLAVFSEIYYPPSKGWNVYIDGQPAEGFVKANYVLRALRVPAGKHKIEMRFEPKAVFVGQNIGRAGSLMLLLLLVGGIYTFYKDEDAMAALFPETEVADSSVGKTVEKTRSKRGRK